MAKISPVSIKYLIHARFEADGVVEKPDIIGAIFGQTEGLLGDDLEMRELQKAGKIGRIEVDSQYKDGKTVGEIEVPSAMNKSETTIVAAALETIERVGPSDTKITIEDIEDIRGSKRDYILERAKKLMERFGESDNDVNEMSSKIVESAKIARMQTYGTENLPCGDISGDELIIVEGRADVINLLKNGVKNVISMNGSKLPETIKDLTKEKESVILFVDGDRGGNLIIKNVLENAKIDFITSAPDGKEVEELTGKEILQSLRKKTSVSEYLGEKKRYSSRETRESTTEERKSSSKSVKKIGEEEKRKIRAEVEDLVGTKGFVIFNKDLEKIIKMPLSRLTTLRLNENEEPYIIAIDGTATPRIIEACEDLGCSNLIATNFVSSDTDVNLVSM